VAKKRVIDRFLGVDTKTFGKRWKGGDIRKKKTPGKAPGEQGWRRTIRGGGFFVCTVFNPQRE